MTALVMNPSVLKQVCAVEGCENRHIARGLCPKHYYHARKAGFDEPPGPKLPTRFPSYCSQPGCDGKTKGHKLCDIHYVRWVYRGRNPEHLTDGSLLERRVSKPWLGRTGEESPRWGGENVTYRGAHKRVDAVKGFAREHPCVDCDAPATQWSYIGGDPDQRWEPRRDDPAKRIFFSLDPDFYQPRCVPCHAAHDRRM